ncbi:MAG: hypothetical protein K6W08_15310, partial [Firmicutes bacterium]|nr:hypothetical protein [Bacillota bacterium]
VLSQPLHNTAVWLPAAALLAYPCVKYFGPDFLGAIRVPYWGVLVLAAVFYAYQAYERRHWAYTVLTAACGTASLWCLLCENGLYIWADPHVWLIPLALAALVLLPLGVYVLSYAPYFALGHGLRDLLALQGSMFRFHAGLTQGHPYQSAWWSWPLLIRPIWYEYRETAPHLYRGVVALGNPVLWWAGLAALVVVAVGAVRTRALPETFLLAGFLLSYLQYAAVRRVLFLYHYLPALPLLFIALAAVLERLRRQVGPGPALALGLLAAAWLVVFYPVLTAVPMPDARILRMMWFGSWI